jgi:hypothetical protein
VVTATVVLSFRTSHDPHCSESKHVQRWYFGSNHQTSHTEDIMHTRRSYWTAFPRNTGQLGRPNNDFSSVLRMLPIQNLRIVTWLAYGKAAKFVEKCSFTPAAICTPAVACVKQCRQTHTEASSTQNPFSIVALSNH